MSIDDLLSEGKKLNDEGKYEEAVTCYDKAIKIDPNNSVAVQGQEDVSSKQKKGW